MPIVNTREFRHVGKAGDSFAFKAPISVDKQGEFSINLPEELLTAALALVRKPLWAGQVVVEKARVNWRAQGRVLTTLERFVEEVLKEHLAVDVTTELVIRYRYENNTAGARGPDGNLHPNGHWADQNVPNPREQPVNWVGNRDIHATNRPNLFGVGVVAQVVRKITYSRPSGTKVDYDLALPGSHFDYNPMRRLNAFIVDAPESRSRSGVLSSGRMGSSCIHEIPYSDAAALFFCDLMLAMLRLGEQLETFVGDREKLQLAIESGQPLLLAAPKTDASLS